MPKNSCSNSNSCSGTSSTTGPRRALWEAQPQRSSGSSSWWASSCFHTILFFSAMTMAMMYGYFMWHMLFRASGGGKVHAPSPIMDSTMIPQYDKTPNNRGRGGSSSGSSSRISSPQRNSCSFRKYPPHRFYQLHQPRHEGPDFLNNKAEYIYGQWPTLLKTHSPTMAQKLCVDQSSWLPNTTTTTTAWTWPFADGTNPSLLSMQRYQRDVAGQNQFQNNNNKIHWIATLCMTNSQCQWRDSPQQTRDYHLNSLQTKPDTVRTLLLLLNEHFETVAQATIYLQLDTRYGNKKRSFKPSPVAYMPALDDARLFVYQQQLWISYREGKLFGYDAQVLNPLHLEYHTDDDNTLQQPRLKATIRASETTSFCCGRNMALMTTAATTSTTNAGKDPLLSLTWVDPVTVVTVDTTTHHQQKQQKASQSQRRRLLSQQSKPLESPQQENPHPPLLWPQSPTIPGSQDEMDRVRSSSSRNAWTDNQQQEERPLPFSRHRRRRQLLSDGRARNKKQRKSHVHGTNAFMVYLPQRREYLDVAHFHRPHDRDVNPYARFGHHYTHALYTISPTAPYQLRSLSPEFVLPTSYYYSQQQEQPSYNKEEAKQEKVDAEIIQFISGLEYDATHNQIVLAYGINDCEGAITRIDGDWVLSNQFLRPVPNPDTQVVDLMQPLVGTVQS